MTQPHLKIGARSTDGSAMSTIEAERATPAPALPEHGPERGWIWAHRWGLLAIVLTVVWSLGRGIPTAAEMVVLHIAVIVLADAVGTKGVAGALGVARDWLPVVAVLIVYKYSRGVADSIGMPVQKQSLVDADELLFFGEVPTVWLQERLIARSTSWWEALTALTYLSHFFASFVLLGVLHARSRLRWAAYLKRFLTLNAMGVATYVLVPAAPPWMASEEGLIGPVERTTVRGIDLLHLRWTRSLIEEGRATTNHVAALPSLHAGYAFLFSIYLLRSARRGPVQRMALVLYPIAMCFALVYSGEHYVIDVVLGFGYALVAHLVWERRERRRAHATAAS